MAKINARVEEYEGKPNKNQGMGFYRTGLNDGEGYELWYQDSRGKPYLIGGSNVPASVTSDFADHTNINGTRILTNLRVSKTFKGLSYGDTRIQYVCPVDVPAILFSSRGTSVVEYTRGCFWINGRKYNGNKWVPSIKLLSSDRVLKKESEAYSQKRLFGVYNDWIVMTQNSETRSFTLMIGQDGDLEYLSKSDYEKIGATEEITQPQIDNIGWSIPELTTIDSLDTENINLPKKNGEDNIFINLSDALKYLNEKTNEGSDGNKIINLTVDVVTDASGSASIGNTLVNHIEVNGTGVDIFLLEALGITSLDQIYGMTASCRSLNSKGLDALQRYSITSVFDPEFSFNLARGGNARGAVIFDPASSIQSNPMVIPADIKPSVSYFVGTSAQRAGCKPMGDAPAGLQWIEIPSNSRFFNPTQPIAVSHYWDNQTMIWVANTSSINYSKGELIRSLYDNTNKVYFYSGKLNETYDSNKWVNSIGGNNSPNEWTELLMQDFNDLKFQLHLITGGEFFDGVKSQAFFKLLTNKPEQNVRLQIALITDGIKKDTSEYINKEMLVKVFNTYNMNGNRNVSVLEPGEYNIRIYASDSLVYPNTYSFHGNKHFSFNGIVDSAVVIQGTNNQNQTIDLFTLYAQTTTDSYNVKKTILKLGTNTTMSQISLMIYRK